MVLCNLPTLIFTVRSQKKHRPNSMKTKITTRPRPPLPPTFLPPENQPNKTSQQHFRGKTVFTLFALKFYLGSPNCKEKEEREEKKIPTLIMVLFAECAHDGINHFNWSEAISLLPPALFPNGPNRKARHCWSRVWKSGSNIEKVDFVYFFIFYFCSVWETRGFKLGRETFPSVSI